MNVAIIGAGNVGGELACRIIDANLADVTLIDVKENIAKAKAADISDSIYFSKSSRQISATSDLTNASNSNIIVITAGFPRKSGMTREDLIAKNSQLIKEIAAKIKPFLKEKIAITVTNPLDLMTFYFKRITNIDSKRLIGMGSGLDSSRFANLIAEKFKRGIREISAVVIGSHGDQMLPLERLTTVRGKSLEEIIPKEEVQALKKRTLERGAEIVALYESGSAYFAPSLAIFEIIKAIILDEKRIIYASSYLNGQYGLKDICLGLPLKIGKAGIEEVINLSLNKQEKKALLESAQSLKALIDKLPS
ncbi:MAG: malate dehydrogenase [Candidatus Omnitrophota bacterium]